MATQQPPSDDTGTPTPPKVEELATEAVALERTALIGTFGSAAAPRALVRLPRGQTQTVTVGDRIAGGTVEAIGADALVLSRAGGQRVLRMPRG